jgi:hypothetical protein
VVDFMAAAEGFMGVVAISAAVVLGGVVAVTAGVAVVMGGMALGIEVARTAAPMGMVAACTGTEVVLPIGGGITHTLIGVTVGKS